MKNSMTFTCTVAAAGALLVLATTADAALVKNSGSGSIYTNPLSGLNGSSDIDLAAYSYQGVDGNLSVGARISSTTTSSGYLRYTLSSSVNAGGIVVFNTCWSGFSGPMNWSVTVNGNTVLANQTSPKDYVMYDHSASFATLSATEVQVNYTGMPTSGGTYYGDMTDLVLLPERWQKLAMTATADHSPDVGGVVGNLVNGREDYSNLGYWRTGGAANYDRYCTLDLGMTTDVVGLLFSGVFSGDVAGTRPFDLQYRAGTSGAWTQIANLNLQNGNEVGILQLASTIQAQQFRIGWGVGTDQVYLGEVMAFGLEQLAIPEPSTLFLFALGGLLFTRAACARRR